MEMCRVRVLCGRAAADLALPAEVPVVDLLPDLVDLVVEDDDRWVRPWQLVHPVRGPLPAEASLARIGVLDGATLVLDDTETPAPVLVEDVADAVGERLAAGGRQPGQPLIRWVGAAVFGAAAAPLIVGGPPDPTGATLAAVVGVFSSLLAAILSRLPDGTHIGTALAVGAVPWWAVAGSGVASGDRPTLAMGALAAAGAAAGVVGALATPSLLRVAPGVALGAGAVAAELGLFARPGRSDVPVAAAAVILSLGALTLLPRVTVAVTGLGRPVDEAMDDQLLMRRIVAGRTFEMWARGGLLAAFLAAVVALAVDGGWWALVLGGAAAGVVGLRARHRSCPEEAITGALAAAGAAIAVAVAIPAAHEGPGRGVATAALALIGATLLGASMATDRPRPTIRKLLAASETALLALTVIAALAAGGAFDYIADLGN